MYRLDENNSFAQLFICRVLLSHSRHVVNEKHQIRLPRPIISIDLADTLYKIARAQEYSGCYIYEYSIYYVLWFFDVADLEVRSWKNATTLYFL